MGGRWSLLGSLRTRRLATLMDRLNRRGGLFLEWASAAFGDGERRGSGELSEDSSSSVGRSISSGAATSLPLPGREGGNGRGSSCDCSARPTSNWVPRRSFSSRNRFTFSRSSTTWLACSSCLASISWRLRRNWSSGAKFAGLLVNDVELRRSCGMFGNSQGFADREVTWERVYLSSYVPPLRFLARRFPQTAPIVVS